MPIRLLQLLFRISVLAFLVGGVLIVLGQAAGIALGDAAWVSAVEEHAGPPTCIAASASGLIAFLLSYANKPQPAEEPQPAEAPAKPQPTGAAEN
ncbi:hypothetical protein ACFWN5_30420 [Streptomyces sp. NPDC058430]|uniref:hypothetical protein n=1 Tax=unclassified Streptomyces TaxID=2593676 RepID=UPI003628325A